MTNQIQSSNNKVFKLEERTAIFGEDIIKFIKTVNQNNINKPLISQLIRSATSVGANYREAVETNQRKIFNIKLEFVKRNARKQNIG
jgi:four helix bundle protein